MVNLDQRAKKIGCPLRELIQALVDLCQWTARVPLLAQLAQNYLWWGLHQQARVTRSPICRTPLVQMVVRRGLLMELLPRSTHLDKLLSPLHILQVLLDVRVGY